MRRLTLAALALAACRFDAGTAGDAGPAPIDTGPPADTLVGGDVGPAIGHRKSLRIPGPQILDGLSDFPVWIDLSDADLAAHAGSDARDIFFTGSDGTTALDYELTSWSPASGRLRAWVRMPALLKAKDAVFYVNYGDAAKAAAPNPAGVFSASFAAVWHFDDSLATPAIADATGSDPGSAVALTGSNQVTGELGGGISFDGTGSAYVNIGNPFVGAQQHTITAWVNTPVAGRPTVIAWLGSNVQNQARYLFAHNASNVDIGAGYYNDDAYATNVDIEGSGWTMLGWSFEGGNKKNHFYVNGKEIAGSPFTTNGGEDTQGLTGTLGWGYAAGFGFLGTLDEVRFATVVRPPHWLAVEYANQSSPATFVTAGSDELQP